MAVYPIKNPEGLMLYTSQLDSIENVRTAIRREINALDEKLLTGDLSQKSELEERKSQLEKCHESRSACFALIETEIAEFNKKAESKTAQAEKNVITPFMRRWWPVSFGLGLILQQTVDVSAAILGKLLLPINFAIDGLRSIWDFYHTWRDKTLAQRKTKLTTLAFNIAALIAASIVFGLAVTNPFALPSIFMGIILMGVYQSGYSRYETASLISEEIKMIQSLEQNRDELKKLEDKSEQTPWV